MNRFGVILMLLTELPREAQQLLRQLGANKNSKVSVRPCDGLAKASQGWRGGGFRAIGLVSEQPAVWMDDGGESNHQVDLTATKMIATKDRRVGRSCARYYLAVAMPRAEEVALVEKANLLLEHEEHVVRDMVLEAMS